MTSQSPDSIFDEEDKESSQGRKPSLVLHVKFLMRLRLDKILSTMLSPLLSLALYSPPSRRASFCVISHSRHLGIRRRLALQIVKFCGESQALLIEYWDCEGDLKEAIVITLASCAFPRLRKGGEERANGEGRRGEEREREEDLHNKIPNNNSSLPRTSPITGARNRVSNK